jgi:hypothetical protein
MTNRLMGSGVLSQLWLGILRTSVLTIHSVEGVTGTAENVSNLVAHKVFYS